MHRVESFVLEKQHGSHMKCRDLQVKASLSFTNHSARVLTLYYAKRRCSLISAPQSLDATAHKPREWLLCRWWYVVISDIDVYPF